MRTGRDIFLVGDDDQTIYAWRLADVRRILGLAAALPGLRRVDLEVNYRCPAEVVYRAVRLIEHGQERFVKVIRAGPAARGRLVLAPDPGDHVARARRLLDAWYGREEVATRCWRGRTPSWRRSPRPRSSRRSLSGRPGRAAAR